MKALSSLRTAAWVGLVTLVLGTQTTLAKPLVYVPLGGEGKIVVIDASKDRIVDAINGVAAVHGLAGTPDGRFLIAGSFDAREPGGAAPEKPSGVSAEDHVAHHGAAPAGAEKASAVVSTVSVVRAADGSVVRRIDVPGVVHHVAVSPNGRFAVVTHPSEGGISAIDLASYEVVTTVATGPSPNYAAFNLDGTRVFVSNAGNDTVSELEPERWIVRRNFVVGTSPEHMILSRDGQRLYVANVGDGTVSEIDVGNGTTTRTFDAGGYLHGIDLSDDGRRLFVSGRERDELVAIDLETGAVHRTPRSPEPYHLATVTGTGKLYVSSAGEPKIWVVDQASLEAIGEIPIRGEGHQMAVVGE